MRCTLISAPWNMTLLMCSVTLTHMAADLFWRNINTLFCYTPTQRIWKGYTGFTLSVCPSVCPSVDRIVSALYLLQYSINPFQIYTPYQATSEGVSSLRFLNPRFNEVESGVYWFHVVRPSVLSGWVLYRQLELTKLTRPDLHYFVGLFILRDVRLSVRPSVDKTLSTLYLPWH